MLSSTQAGPGRKVKQEQEEISRNHVPRLFLGSVCSEFAYEDESVNTFVVVLLALQEAAAAIPPLSRLLQRALNVCLKLSLSDE